jgi:hypothetical protein
MDKLLYELAKSLRKDGSFPPHIQEEFLNDNGTLNYQYIGALTGVAISRPKFDAKILPIFGRVSFVYKKKVKSTITPEEFLELYEFGRYPSVRQWIGAVYRLTGKTLTRRDLFETLSKQSPKSTPEYYANEAARIRALL